MAKQHKVSRILYVNSAEVDSATVTAVKRVGRAVADRPFGAIPF
jgi:hypothetical protein